MLEQTAQLRSLQQVSLIVLRTLIGWHFLYEAYYKIVSPAWSHSGAPLAPWTSAGYLSGATGPLAPLFQRMASSSFMPWVDRGVKVALLLIGLSLLLGFFTRVGATGAFLLLSLFYLLYIPTLGVPQPNAEGSYLIVNKTLIEAAAVLVLFVFDTGKIAGLDLLFKRRQVSKREVNTENKPVERIKDKTEAYRT